MRIIKNIFIAGFLIILVLSCVEPYDIRSINFDRAIVVEGRITNELENNYVKLSFTRPVDENQNAALTNARVWVEGSDGSRFEFTEAEPGYYLPEAEVMGEAGISYQLFFVTADDRQYQSSVQELIASPPIDRVYNSYAEKPSGTSDEVNQGIQFFIDTHDETNRAQYYKYEYEETYEVKSQYPSLYEFSHDPDTAIFRQEQVNICYPSAESSAIIIGTTANLSENRLSEMPVRYITNRTDQLRYAYSILVKQFVISSQAYNFYREFLENNKDNGSLFDKQLGVVAGNVNSVDDPEETVLGFFEVAGVSEARVFVEYEDLDSRFPWPEPEFPCTPNQLVYFTDSVKPPPYNLKDSIGMQVRNGYEITVAAYCSDGCPLPYYFKTELAPKYCTDCRFRGPATKPEFWIY